MCLLARWMLSCVKHVLKDIWGFILMPALVAACPCVNILFACCYHTARLCDGFPYCCWTGSLCSLFLYWIL